jgi:hypothetical protein
MLRLEAKLEVLRTPQITNGFGPRNRTELAAQASVMEERNRRD